MIRIAIVDDEQSICTQIENCLNRALNLLSLKAQSDIYNSGTIFIDKLNSNEKYDLILLDIELDCCSGIDVGNCIRNKLGDESTQIVYVSGKNGYDRKLFEFRPMAFIEKPVDLNKIMNVLSKYNRIYGNQSELFKYKINRDTFYANINEILYFQSSDRKVIIVKSSQNEEFYGSIENVYNQLKNKGFFIPHRSYLVNYRFIKGFYLKEIIMTNGAHIPISDSRREEIFKIQLLMENGE